MNYIKRAVKSLLYHKKNTILTLAIFTILSTLILSGICIYSAGEQSARNIRQNIGASITANCNYSYSDDIKGKNAITGKRVSEIASLDEVKFTSVNIESNAKSDDLSAIISVEQQNEYNDSAPFYVFGDSYTLDNKLFSKEGYSIAEGAVIENDAEESAIIHIGLAEQNKLKIGDEIEFTSDYNNVKVKLKINGVFKTPSESNKKGQPYLNYENHIFTSPDIARKLNGDDMVKTAIFGIKDPAKVNEVIEMAEDIPKESKFDNDIIFTKQDSEYKAMASVLNSISTISIIMVISSILMGASLLTLLVVMAMNSRETEIGVLLSIGESRVKIVLQLIIESLIPVLLAVSIGIGISSFAAGWISDFIGGSELSVSLNAISIILIYICGILLTLIASTVTTYKVARYNPKKMLIAVE